MQQINKLLVITAIVFASIALALSIMVYTTKNATIGYVRTQYLVENFTGMKEAKEEFKQKFKDQQVFFDSIQLAYRALEVRYKTSAVSDKKATEAQLIQMRGQVAQYADYFRRVSEEEDRKVTEQVLNQINAYVKEYGESHNTDIIIGSTSSGNILYGREKYDVTEDLLKYINGSYKGKK